MSNYCVSSLLQLSRGQDKLFRVVQYLLRLILHHNSNRSEIQQLEHQITLTRKLCRFTRDAHYFRAGLVALNNPDKLDGAGRAIAAFGKCVWLFSDHIEYLYRVGVLRSDGKTPAARVSRVSNWLWLIGYIGSVSLYYRQIKLISEQITKLRNYHLLQDLETDHQYSNRIVLDDSHELQINQLVKKQRQIKLQMLQELVDCGIPAGGLGLVPHSVGCLAGISSSFIGLFLIKEFGNCS